MWPLLCYNRAGIIIYFRKEGRALGEVTKYLVYNLRKRQEGGDSAEEYFNCTQTVAGIQDVRFQALMPDALHWLGITKIDKFVSMSDMKYDAIVNSVRLCFLSKNWSMCVLTLCGDLRELRLLSVFPFRRI